MSGLAVQRTAAQPLLERRLVPGRDIARIEACDPCGRLALDGGRIGKCQYSALVRHYAYPPSMDLICLLGFGKGRGKPLASGRLAMGSHKGPAT